MTQSGRSGGPGEEVHTSDEARSPEGSESGPPVAIIGIACRFPGADGLSASNVHLHLRPGSDVAGGRAIP